MTTENDTPRGFLPRRGPASRPWFWALLAIACALALAGRALRARGGGGGGAGEQRASGASLPVLWQLPAWSLTDQDGRPFGSAQLRGRVYVANFIFTTCLASCPMLTREMARLQARLRAAGAPVHLVSMSVDPVNDTPSRLRAYGARNRADFATWTFVTGPEQDVMRAVSEGFRVGVQQPPRGPDGSFDPIALAHANRFALVDGAGRLRGSYEADPEGLARLAADAEALARAERGRAP